MERLRHPVPATPPVAAAWPCAKSHGHAPMRLRTGTARTGKPSTARNAKQTQKAIKKPQGKRKTIIKPGQPKNPDHPRGSLPCSFVSFGRQLPAPLLAYLLPPRRTKTTRARFPVPSRFRFPLVTHAAPHAHQCVRFGAAGHPGSVTLEPSTGWGMEWIHSCTRGSHRTTSSAKTGAGAGGLGFSHGSGASVRLCVPGGVVRFVWILALSRLTRHQSTRTTWCIRCLGTTGRAELRNLREARIDHHAYG